MRRLLLFLVPMAVLIAKLPASDATSRERSFAPAHEISAVEIAEPNAPAAPMATSLRPKARPGISGILSTNSPDKIALFEEVPKAAALTIPPRTNPAAKPVNFVFVTGDRVNLRAGPGTQNKRLGVARRGQKLVLHETKGDWARVGGRLNGEPVAGWMSTRYLADQAQATASETPAKARQRGVAVPRTGDIIAAKKAMIDHSIAAYPGSCACPYNLDREGRRCGKRSAWSRKGGYAPLCYDSDVTDARLATHLARQRGATH